MTEIRVREEAAADRSAIASIHRAAFGQEEEAMLVDRLREDGDALLSLVAEIDGRVVGHVLFSRMGIDSAGALVPAVALAPIGVRPEHQRRGIGGALIRRGLDSLRETEETTVIVVGDPGYYGRFGFAVDVVRDLAAPFRRESFMGLELAEGSLAGLRGRVVYPAAFGI